MRRAEIAAILSTIFLASCSPDTAGHVGTSTSEAADLKPLIATGFIGFFTEPHHRSLQQTEGEGPVFEPITYMGLDAAAALGTSNKLAAMQDYAIVSSETLAAAITEDDKLESFQKTLEDVLRATHMYQRTADTDCEICENLSLSPVSKFENYRDWDSRDRIILVVGLETLSPNNNGLRSGLGAFAFNPSGQYVDHVFVDYNFTRYLTDDFAEDMFEIYNALLLTQ